MTLMLGVLSTPLLAQQVSDEQRAAIKSACRGDYASVCSGVPTGGTPALQCLQQHSQQVSGGCQKALAAVAPASPAPSPAAAQAATPGVTAGATPAVTSAATPQAPRAAQPREEARILRAECGEDFHKLCADVAVGAGRGATCLRAHAASLSPRCSSALSSLAPK
jgi:hypothetical protein